MTKDEALRLALGALKSKDGWGSSVRDAKEKAIAACEAALEAKDEPPRFPTMLRKMWSGTEVQEWVNENWQALPQRKPLTDEERFKMWSETDFRGSGGQYDWFVEGIRAAEAAHGIKGEA